MSNQKYNTEMRAVSIVRNRSVYHLPFLTYRFHYESQCPTHHRPVSHAFLARQFVERDGRQNRFIEGIWGIFGHGNAGGFGQGIAELAHQEGLSFYRPQNEQGMVHLAAAFAKHRNRLATFAVRLRLGPGRQI